MILFDPHSLMVTTDTGTILPLDVRSFVREVWHVIDRNQHELLPEIEESLIQSILSTLSQNGPDHPISLESLCKLMSKLLMEFASETQPHQNTVEIDLDRLAMEYGSAFELGFYQKIRQIFQPFTPLFNPPTPSISESPKSIRFRITGLRSCAKHLSNRRRWCQASSKLRDEIVDYIREQAEASGTPHLLIVIC